MGPGLSRTAQPERTRQARQRRAGRAPAHHRHLPAHRLRRHRSGRPARQVPLVRALHPAPAGHPRRQDRHARARRARGRVLHAAHPHRRRPAYERPAARHRRHLARVRPRHRRHHRPAERAAALDPHRGRPDDLGASRGRRAVDDRGVRRHPARHARLPARGTCPPTRCSTPGRRCARPSRSISAIRRSRICRASSRPRSRGCAQHCTNHEINDVSFVGVVGPDGEPGFDLWVGGGLSTNPRFAERLGVFVRPDEVSEVWAGVVSVFRDYGYRRSAQPRPAEVPHGRLGTGEVPQGAAGRVPASAQLPDGEPPPASPAHRDHTGIRAQNNGLLSVGRDDAIGTYVGHRRCTRSPNSPTVTAAGGSL